MSKYRITLDGKTYEMEVELIDEGKSVVAPPKNDYKSYNGLSKDPTINIVDPSKQKESKRNAGSVFAPMPGTIIKVEKSEGQTVKAGDLVLILEAMKMENEILAPVDGTIKTMNCAANNTVSSGELLFEII